MNKRKARIIAFYLPQFHPIPENDEWWGKGFTEWVNVANAKPLFKGHYQPHIPADLGFYDLRLPQVREAQAELAREAGIEGFCYWHYWFGNGKQLLERPFNEVLTSGKPDFPFSLCWANHSWSNKTWDKDSQHKKSSILMEQKYLGKEDNINHFYSVLDAFKDKRYIRVDGKPLFLIFDPLGFPNIASYISLWRQLAAENGLNGIHFVGMTDNASFREIGKVESGKIIKPDLDDAGKRYQYVLDLGFDAVNSIGTTRAKILTKGLFKITMHAFIGKVVKIRFINRCDQKEINKYLYVNEDRWENVYPTIIPNWDRSPRTINDTIHTNSTPQRFKNNILDGLELLKNKNDDHKILFLKSWNEWGEGNHVEPDIKYGKGYLNALKEALCKG
jgi:hypothetical protein